MRDELKAFRAEQAAFKEQLNKFRFPEGSAAGNNQLVMAVSEVSDVERLLSLFDGGALNAAPAGTGSATAPAAAPDGGEADAKKSMLLSKYKLTELKGSTGEMHAFNSDDVKLLEDMLSLSAELAAFRPQVVANGVRSAAQSNLCFCMASWHACSCCSRSNSCSK